jgi:hypothetical protein
LSQRPLAPADASALAIVLEGWGERAPASVAALQEVCARRARYHCRLRRLTSPQDVEEVEHACVLGALEALRSQPLPSAQELFDRLDVEANTRAARVFRQRRRVSGSERMTELEAPREVGLDDDGAVQRYLSSILADAIHELDVSHPTYAREWAQYFASPGDDSELPAKRSRSALREALLRVVERRVPETLVDEAVSDAVAQALGRSTPKSHYSELLRRLLGFLRSAGDEAPGD